MTLISPPFSSVHVEPGSSTVLAAKEMTMSEDQLDDEDTADEEPEFDEDGEEAESPHAVQFDQETEGVVIAGKCFDSAPMTRKDLGEFATKVEAVGSAAGHALTVVPSGDLTDTGPSPDDTVYAAVHVGFEGARGGTYGPDTLSMDAVHRAIERAQQVPDAVWAEIAALLDSSQREKFEQAPVALHFTCVGPLAAATLAIGVLGTKDGEGPGEYMHGQDMEQEPHEEGVWGQRVAYVQYESPESEEIDLSPAAHEERVKELGVSDARYFVIARYD